MIDFYEEPTEYILPDAPMQLVASAESLSPVPHPIAPAIAEQEENLPLPPTKPTWRIRTATISKSLFSWLLAILAAVLTSLYYLPTVHPGVGPHLDSVELQTTVAMFGVSHPPGYPLYTFLARLFTQLPFDQWFFQLTGQYLAPFGDNYGWRVNLFSTFVALLAIIAMHRLLYRLTRRAWLSFLGALILGAGVRFWYQATYAELYPLYNLIILLAFNALFAWMDTRRVWNYYFSVFFFALAFTVNIPALVLIPAWVFGVVVTDYTKLIRPIHLALTTFTILVAASLYFWIPLRSFLVGPAPFCNYCPSGWDGVLGFLTGERWRDLHLAFGKPPADWWQRSADSGYDLMLQFWPIGVMLGGIGIAYLFSKHWRVGGTLLLALTGSWFFVITYNTVDWSDFMTPVYVFFTPFVVLGMLAVWDWIRTLSKNWPTTRWATAGFWVLFSAILGGLIAFYVVFLPKQLWQEPLPYLTSLSADTAMWMTRFWLLLALFWLIAVLTIIIGTIYKARRDDSARIPQRLMRFTLSMGIALITPFIIYNTFNNNLPIVQTTPNHSMIWHWWARDLLPKLEPNAWLIVPPTATNGFVQSWALRFVSWAEGQSADMTMIYPPIDEDPPGPPPGYLRWNEVKDELEKHPVYVIELNDDRLKQFALYPITRDNDGLTIGYRIVGERNESDITPWVSADIWAKIKDDLLLP